VAMDESGKPTQTKKWIPTTEREIKLEEYAEKLNALREQINSEMMPFFNEVQP
jgi:hypothetical protein